MFTVEPDGQGFSHVEIDLDVLYEGIPGRDSFERKIEPFLQADPLAKEIIKLDGNCLQYRTEHIHAETSSSNRKRILFLLGNPAVHSVATGIPFAYENTKNGGIKEHRFWKALRETGYINSPYDLCVEDKRIILFTADYNSEIIFNLEVFFTLPSTASSSKNAKHPIQKMSGVQQIHSLLGIRALCRIAAEESKRLLPVMSKYDAIIVCQKDAYNGVKGTGAPEYTKGTLKRKFYQTTTLDGTPLFCVQPTYLFSTQIVQEHLSEIRNIIIDNIAG